MHHLSNVLHDGEVVAAKLWPPASLSAGAMVSQVLDVVKKVYVARLEKKIGMLFANMPIGA